MRSSIILLFFVLVSLNLYCQLPVKVDSIFSVIRNKSIHRNQVDWKNIENGFYSRLQSSKNDIDSIKSLVYVFESLGDVHSTVTYNGKQYGNYPIFDESTLKSLVPIVIKSQEQTGIIKIAILENKVAYIQIPGIQAWGEKTNEYAQAISDSICKFNPQKIIGYIIDLRLNSGGQLSSMLGGLSSLLGDGYLGGGVTVDGTEISRFDILKGNFRINEIPMTSIRNKGDAKLSDKNVAILIGPATRSSGSITAISFKLRPKTIFIGEPTANGYSTGNDYFYFGTNLDMNLSTLFSQDRGKKIYPNSVNPDITIVGGDDFEELSNDKKINSAIDWIKSNNNQ